MFIGAMHKALSSIMMTDPECFTRIGKNLFAYERWPNHIEKYVIVKDGTPIPDFETTITRIMQCQQVIEEHLGDLYHVIRIW